MNADRFDALSQIVTSTRRRRGVVRALLGLAAGSALLPGLAEPTVARKKRKRQAKPCGPCQQRENGRCRSKPNGTRCGECGECFDGVCGRSKVGCGECRECDATGRCRVKADDATCGTAGKCLGGICNERPTCTRAGSPCSNPDGSECCGGICQIIIANARFCLQGPSGASCIDNDDCAEGLSCVGYRCG